MAIAACAASCWRSTRSASRQASGARITSLGAGCSIYEHRPAACATFQCLWLKQSELGPEWQPNKSRFVLYFDGEGTQLVVNVDPAQAKAWRKEPFLSTLREWARHGLETGVQVVVKIGRHIIALLPDREIDLGEVGDGERIRFSRVHTPEGVSLMAQKVTDERG